MIFKDGYNRHNKTLTWVYAIGEVETMLGYDICETNNMTLIDAYNKLEKEEIKEFIMEEKVQIGTDIKRCIVMMWRGTRTVRGFIFDPFDIDSLEHASKSYIKKSEMI